MYATRHGYALIKEFSLLSFRQEVQKATKEDPYRVTVTNYPISAPVTNNSCIFYTCPLYSTVTFCGHRKLREEPEILTLCHNTVVCCWPHVGTGCVLDSALAVADDILKREKNRDLKYFHQIFLNVSFNLHFLPDQQISLTRRENCKCLFTGY